MPSSPARRWRAAGLPITLVVVVGLAVLAAQAATPGRAVSNPRPRVASAFAPSATTVTTVTTVSPLHPSVAPAPPPPRAAPASTTAAAPSPPAPAASTAPDNGPATAPPVGQATQWGCTAALAYLAAHAYPGFTLECPGNAQGHEGMTCKDWPGLCPGQLVIAIADPCPAAYMNEASNSWMLMGASDSPEDPYGSC
jgi:hypothetical protein